jgi:zinc transporter 1/2/3
MFNNECLGVLDYEATTSAIVMAGIFISFLFEYIGHRIIVARNRGRHNTRSSAYANTTNLTTKADGPTPHSAAATTTMDDGAGTHAKASHSMANLGHNHGSPFDPTNPNSKLSVSVMEAGILFHSILIGLTLVVAGGSFYKTLLVVIVFHQFFEGLALGVRIALLPKEKVSFWRTKFPMALAFALITPLGMAIGVGVMHQWNGNDRSTIITIGTLDAVSAGILVWVGVVDMWARDWIIDGGEMTAENAGFGKICLGLVSLVAGLVGMSVLGKWA